MKRRFKAPTLINLELTELCNVKCRHCYNFWRDESMGVVSLDKSRIDKLVDRFVEAGIFHVIVSGGEPMANFDLLEYAFKRLSDVGMSVSCNSNLMLVSPERIERLKAVGLDHILTSLPSPDPAQCDYIMNKPGAYEQVIEGIGSTVDGGIRVSANFVVTRKSMDKVYDAGRLLSELGAEKYFITRAVPPTYSDTNVEDDYTLTPEEQKFTLDEAIRAKEDFGIGIGTLVSYPLCFLGDLEHYADFVGRGCPAQSGHRMSINANGEVHACVHEEEAYGNVFDVPISEIYMEKMNKWHDGSFHNPACAGCRYEDVCESGCSMVSVAVGGEHSAKDPLFVGPDTFEKHVDLGDLGAMREILENGAELRVNEGLRFRDDGGFMLVNVRWGNSFPVDKTVGQFLRDKQEENATFTLADFGETEWVVLCLLINKEAVATIEDITKQLPTRERPLGLSLNVDALPVNLWTE
ncbi:radical SAM protein [Rhodospirillales bacterium]|nr:radical SAM protein [Rhodospirillales bacterium]